MLEKKLTGIDKSPSAIINFIEGTRFTVDKAGKSNSPYRHLLNPRAGGFYFILNTFGREIDFLLDITLTYDCENPVFFKFLSRRCRRVGICINKIPMNDLLSLFKGENQSLEFHKVNSWLKNLWYEKDKQIANVQSS